MRPRRRISPSGARQSRRDRLEGRARLGGDAGRSPRVLGQATEVQHGPGLGPLGDGDQGGIRGVSEHLGRQGVQHLAGPGQRRVAAVLLDQPGQTLIVQQHVQGQAGGHLSGRQRVENRPGQGGEELDLGLPVGATGETRRHQRHEPPGRLQGGGVEGRQQGEQGRALGLGRNRGRRLLAVADHGIGEIHPAQQLAGRLHLITMHQIDGHVLAAERRHWLSRIEGAQAEAGKRGLAHGQHPLKFGGRVRAVVPKAAPGLADA